MDSSGGLSVFLHITLLCVLVHLTESTAPTIASFALRGSSYQSSIDVEEGYRLVCVPRVSGAPPPTITFYKDGELDPQAASNKLIKTITRNDEGLYWIVANNSVGAAISRKVRLSIFYVNAWPEPTVIEDLNIVERSALVLNVPHIEANPPPDDTSLQWFKSPASAPDSNDATERVVVGDQYHITLSMQLIVLSTPQFFGGKVYQAEYSNFYTPELPSTRSKRFKLRIEQKTDLVSPEFVISLPNVTYAQRTGVGHVLECVVNAHPLNNAQISWYRKPAQSGDAPPISITHSLAFNNRRCTINNFNDGDVYSCEAGSGSSLITSSTTISVVEPPSTEDSLPLVFTKDLGSQITIPCQVKSNPPANITWYKNAVPVVPTNRLLTHPNGSLSLFNIQFQDTAVYQCIAENPYGSLTYQTHLKLNRAPPSIITPPRNKTVLSGEEVLLTCLVAGEPWPDVYWSFNPTFGGGMIGLTSGPRLTTTNTSVQIPSAIWSDSGTYQCKANNTLDTAQASSYVTVYNRTTIISPENVQSDVFKSAHVNRSCLLDKDSRVSVTILWYLNNNLIIPDGSRRLTNGNQTLSFNPVRSLLDEGTFTCRVTSLAGNGSRSYDIIVLESPHPVEPLARLSGEDRINITWQAPYDGNRPILKYVIKYKSGTPNFVLLEDNIGSQRTSYEAVGLKPAKTYQFVVSAHNSVGASQETFSTEAIRIPPKAPSLPPVIEQVTATSNSLTIKFNPPPQNGWNSETLTGYIVEYGQNAPSLGRKVVDETQTTVEIRDLLPYNLYWVMVAAINEVNTTEHVFSAKYSKTTAENVPVVAPSIRNCTGITSTKCFLEWDRPPYSLIRGDPKGYRIRVYEMDEMVALDPIEVDWARQTSQSTQIGSLKKFTSYRVTLTIYNNAGEGPANTTYCTTLEDAPEAVRELRIPQFTHESILVSWLPPAVSNGILRNYTLEISQFGEDGTEQSYEIPETNYTVGGLLPKTEYNIRVTANTIRPGPRESIRKTTRGPPEKPSKVTEVEVKDVGSRSLIVNFHLDWDGDAPITLWIVEAQQPGDVDWTVLASVPTPITPANELEITNLKPYRKYRLRIIAKNIKGNSEPSDPTNIITTAMAAPDTPPSNVTARPQNNSTLIINWEPLDLEDFNGEGARYRVDYRKDKESSWNQRTVHNPGSRFYVLENLLASSTYHVRLISVNNVNESLPSDQVTSTTIEGVPSVGPFFERFISVSSSEIDLLWTRLTAEQLNGKLLGYRLIYAVDGASAPTMEVTTTDWGMLLGNLFGYTQYNLQVLAYTHMGDGALSLPIQVRTLQDKPSVPRSFGIDNIQLTSLRLTWQVPEHANSPIADITYTLRYWKTDGSHEENLTSITQLNQELTGLSTGAEYRFELRAVNTKGASDAAVINYAVTSPSTLGVPSVPRSFKAALAGSRNITLTWQRTDDNGVPLSNYTLWYKPEAGVYAEAQVYIAAHLETYTLLGLTPSTKYFFKLAAVNGIGESEMTAEQWNTTAGERPSLAPSNLKVVPKTATSLDIVWSNPGSNGWNGVLLSTRIWYTIYDPENRKILEDYSFEEVSFPSTNLLLENLLADNLYEIRLSSVNSEGYSVPSSPTIIYVGVAVPVGAPASVSSGEAGNETITVAWQPVQDSEVNGQLLGYKVYYTLTGVPKPRSRRAVTDTSQYDLVGPEKSSHTIRGLQTYKEYSITITAYNIAGDGPSSLAIIVSTDEGVPGRVGNLSVAEVTLEVVNVTWEAPTEPNGIITEYVITSTQDDDTLDAPASANGFSSTQFVPSPSTFIEVRIRRSATFNFTVFAKTKKGSGDAISSRYTSGPKPGSPKAPETAEYSDEENGILVKWTVSSTEESEILGFLVEGQNNDWQYLHRESDASANKVLLSSDVLPVRNLYSGFRVSLFNSFGLGNHTDAKQVEPYYRSTWFLVIIALSALVIIIIITASLCCYYYKMRAKQAEEAYEQDVIGVDGYNTYEMNQSFKRENRRGSKYRNEPPRPSPSAVQYAAGAAPPGYDESSITEKEDLSSEDDAKGDGSASDSSEDDIDKAGAASVTSSYNNYQYGGYNPYVQSGAVQRTWQNSFGRGRHQPNMYAYTDSEAESSRAPSTSHYRSTTGLVNNSQGSRQHLVNTSPELTPGTRGPLPGFSSFV